IPCPWFWSGFSRSARPESAARRRPMSRAEENREASPLLAILRARIEREGPLPVDAYMRTCLAHPEHGYWRGAESIGTGGGLVSAAESRQVLGELVRACV